VCPIRASWTHRDLAEGSERTINTGRLRRPRSGATTRSQGSSAACDSAEGSLDAAAVTFTPRLIAAETDAVAGRWCDLLVLEAVALGVVSSRGIPAARAHVVERPSHRFLASERVGRAGARGRLAVLSLAAVHDDPAHSWAQAAVELRNAGRLSDEDARRLRWLDAFGALIGNTDRHQFNVLVFPAGASLRLAPAFDQVSVLYAPSGDGRVPAGALALPRPSSDTLDVWDDARAAALDFWERASDDGRVSDDLRNVCSANARALLAGQGPSSG